MYARKTGFLFCAALCAVLLAAPCAAPAQSHEDTSGWKQVLRSRLPLYGDRNWIVVADSAFPEYSEPGIETIVVHEDLPTVLKYVAGAIASSKHLRSDVYLDRELKFVDEQDYPGVSQLRKTIHGDFAAGQISSIPHVDVLKKIADAGAMYRILFIKTTGRIPYSSVYIRLDCGYMTVAVRRKIDDAMHAAGAQQSK